MVLDNDRAIFMVLKNIKNNSPYDFTDSDTYKRETGKELAPMSEAGHLMKKWETVVWNKNIKQMFLFTGGISALEFIKDVSEILSEWRHKQRVICAGTSYEILNNQIKKIKGEWLLDISSQSGIFYLDDVFCIYRLLRDEKGVVFKFYQGKIKSKEMPLLLEGVLSKEENRQILYRTSDIKDAITDDEANKISGTWLRVLFFLEFAEVQTKIVNRLHRKIKVGNEKILNNTDFQFEIIDSNYYTNIIRTEGFGVSGHWRFQPFGSGRMDKKLIWIKDFKKDGYKRDAKILKDKTTWKH